jgi:NAD(P)H-hydrate epimerase
MGKAMSELQIIDDLPDLPARPDDAHKGTFGTIIIVGGCATMIGAPALCATSALRAGAGLVKIATEPGILAATITIEPSATGIALDDDAIRAADQLDEADPDCSAVLAVGPGLGRSNRAASLVDRLLDGRRTIVLDADGLNKLAESGRELTAEGPDIVMTPHPGEFARLASPLGIEHDPKNPATRPQAAAELAQRHHAVVLLKGTRTVVSDGQRVYVNTTGGPALSTAGTGDVLTGLIGSLIAQGMQPFDAATLGAYLHGRAADLWTARRGPRGLTATELARLLPEAMQQ